MLAPVPWSSDCPVRCATSPTVGELSVSPAPATVDDLLDVLSRDHPVLVRRIRDETGSVRQYVNVYVGDDDIRHGAGLATALSPGAVVHLLPSVAGG